MSEITLGKITSTPDAEGKHKLRCPQCSNIFRSAIQKDEKSGELLPITCTKCSYSNDAKHFVAAAQQDTVNRLARDYMDQKIKKAFGNSIEIKLKL